MSSLPPSWCLKHAPRYQLSDLRIFPEAVDCVNNLYKFSDTTSPLYVWNDIKRGLSANIQSKWTTPPLDMDFMRVASLEPGDVEIVRGIPRKLGSLKLREYQRVTLYVMRRIEEHFGYGNFSQNTTNYVTKNGTSMIGWNYTWIGTRCAIMANLTGSGKTAVVTSLIKTYRWREHQLLAHDQRKTDWDFIIHNKMCRKDCMSTLYEKFYKNDTQQFIGKIKLPNITQDIEQPPTKVDIPSIVKYCGGWNNFREKYKVAEVTINVKGIAEDSITIDGNESRCKYYYYPFCGWISNTNIIKSDCHNAVHIRRCSHYISPPTVQNNEFVVVKSTQLFCKGNLVPQWIKEFEIGNITYIKASKVFGQTQKLQWDVYIASVIVEAIERNIDVIIWRLEAWNNVCRTQTNCSFRMVIDEYDTVAIPAMLKPPEHAFLWMISGTWSSNRTEPSFTCLDRYHIRSSGRIVGDGYISPTIPVVRCHPRWINNCIKLPPIIYNYYQIRTDTITRLLHSSGLVNNEILRLIDAGNIKEALINMGCRRVETSGDIFRYIKQLEKTNIRDIIAKIKKLQDTYQSIKLKRSEKGLINDTKHIEKLKNRISEQKNSVRRKFPRYRRLRELCRSEMHTCCVCLEEFNRETITLMDCCQTAILCYKCLGELLKNQKICPLCRHVLDTETLWAPPSGANINHENMIFDTKINALIHIIHAYPEGKFLVFAWSEISCRTIRSELMTHRINSAVIYQSEIRSKTTLSSFVEGKISILLAGARKVASGLHLPTVTDVIMFQTIEPTIGVQCITRAHRYPRKTSLRVHFLLHQSEVNTSSVQNSLVELEKKLETEKEGYEFDEIAYNSDYFSCITSIYGGGGF